MFSCNPKSSVEIIFYVSMLVKIMINDFVSNLVLGWEVCYWVPLGGWRRDGQSVGLLQWLEGASAFRKKVGDIDKQER